MKTEMNITKKLNIEIPALPNFVKATEYHGNNSLREEIQPCPQTLCVEDFTVEQLQKIGEAWTAALIDHAENRRKSKSSNQN